LSFLTPVFVCGFGRAYTARPNPRRRAQRVLLATMAVAVFVAVGGGACYNPKQSDCVVPCGPKGACPAGMSCSLGFCTSDQACPSAYLDGSAEVDVDVDVGSPDAEGADVPTDPAPDGSPDALGPETATTAPADDSPSLPATDALAAGMPNAPDAETPEAPTPEAVLVGLIPKVPGGGNAALCPDEVTVYLDDLDSDNRNAVSLLGADLGRNDVSVGGFVHTAAGARRGGNSVLAYCREAVRALPRTRRAYAVLAADTIPRRHAPSCSLPQPRCPAGSFAFTRIIECQDDPEAKSRILSNASLDRDPNRAWAPSNPPRGLHSGCIGAGNPLPSGAVSLNFCFVPADPTAADELPSEVDVYDAQGRDTKRDFGRRYLFFSATTNDGVVAVEESPRGGTRNAWIAPPESAAFLPAMTEILSNGNVTLWHLRWTGAAPAVFSRGEPEPVCGPVTLEPTCTDPWTDTACKQAWARYAWDSAPVPWCKI
jgi:hypothetical protein